MSGAPVLELSGVSRHFGGVRAVDDVTLSVPRGARHGVIGPNGAGKSTLFKLITGSLAVSAGTIALEGHDITSVPVHQRARLGVAQTFQHSSLFPGLSCRDNVVLAVQRLAGDERRLRRRDTRGTHARVAGLLERVGLGQRGEVPCAALSHGERRQLEVALALAGEPRLLLLDEPAAGMSPRETARLAETIEGLPAELTVILIEHDLDLVFRLAGTIAVLHLGAVIADGPADVVRASREVEEVYLGDAADEDLFFEDEVPR